MTTPAHIYKTARRQMRKIRHRGPKSDRERALLESADRQRESGLGWRLDGFSETSTEEIFGKLSELGIASSADGFREEALAHGTPTKLAEAWTAASRAEGKWADYPTLAARELWRRLLKDEMRPEVVSDELDDFLERAEVSSDTGKLLLWRQAAHALTSACLRQGTEPDTALFGAILRESGCDLTGWMEEMPPLLMGTEFESEAADLCRDFAHFTSGPSLLAERAEILLRLGDAASAVSEIEALLREHPDEPAVLLKAGGIFESVGRADEAQKCLGAYTRALEAKRRAAHTRISSPAAAAPGDKVSPVPFGLMRVSPNAPCPCGSGKKFKRCHGAGH